MNVIEWKAESEKLVTTCMGIFDSKGAEYHENGNVFANIERVSHSLGVHPEVVIMTYLQKHYDSICTYVKRESTNSVLKAAGQSVNEVALSEPIEGRIADAINYLLFLNAFINSNKIESAKVQTSVEIENEKWMDKIVNNINKSYKNDTSFVIEKFSVIHYIDNLISMCDSNSSDPAKRIDIDYKPFYEMLKAKIEEYKLPTLFLSTNEDYLKLFTDVDLLIAESKLVGLHVKSEIDSIVLNCFKLKINRDSNILIHDEKGMWK